MFGILGWVPENGLRFDLEVYGTYLVGRYVGTHSAVAITKEKHNLWFFLGRISWLSNIEKKHVVQEFCRKTR